MYLSHFTSCFVLTVIFIYCLQTSKAGGGKKGNSRIIELLTAGIVAKVLQKQNGEGGGGGGGGGSYYPIPIPLPVGGGGGGQKHHHITEKIIPIPVPHHTTRIIHINAGDNHQGHHEHHGYDGGSGHHEEEDDYGSHNHHGHGSSRIQQLLLHDNGIYNTHRRPPIGVLYRRPTKQHSHPQVRYLAHHTPYGTQIIPHRIPIAPMVGYRQMQPMAFNAYPVFMHPQFRGW